MKIICATDFSEPSVQTTRVAARLARRFGDDLLLVHAWTSPFLFYRELVNDPLKVEEKMAAKAAADLQTLAGTLRAEGIAVEKRVLHSADPAEAITALAKEVDARLIVVGARSGHIATRLFIGGAAERTMLLSDRPVLVVHGGTTSLEEWGNRRQPLRVVVGLDRSAASMAALDWVRSLRALGPCDVTFVHAFWPVEQYARLGINGAVDLAVPDEETMRVLTRELRPLFADLPGEGTVDLRLKAVWGSAAEAILDEAKATKADLLVLGTHQKGALARLWAGSTVQPTVRMAELPVVCVPASEGQQPAAPPRPQLRNILVATDFSDLGNRAVAYAYELARGGGSVTLCHIYERTLPVPAYAYNDTRDALTDAQRRDFEDRLRVLIPAEAVAERIATTISLLDGGDAATAIVQDANRVGADAICVGSHGRSGLGRALMGSVAETVARRAQRPVLIVRPGA